jgi:cholesterol oxidase
MSFDVIVIGSGFGGAITGCRLAEAGYKVLILERGRRWDKSSYPRKVEDRWVWDSNCPEKKNGWMEVHAFRHMAVAQGAAVGGGSLIYANISCEAPASVFANGWPQEITYDELKPHYDEVAHFMNVQKVPDNQWTARMRLMQDGAKAIGAGDRFKKLDLAVSFDQAWNYDLPGCHDAASSKPFINAQGVAQGTCVHLGNCDIGCDVDARNTLDRNYIPWAEKHGAQVRELHLVTNIEPLDAGYRVHFDRLDNEQRVAGEETARIVIVAASSLGSTELLLRCRDVTGSLPALSPFLGRDWSSNGDFLTPAFYSDRDVLPSTGPTITCAIDFLDRSQSGESFWIEDGGFPNLVADYVKALKAGADPGNLRAKIMIEAFGHMLRDDDAQPFRNVMPWFAQGVDAANGVLSLQRDALDGKRSLSLDWEIEKSKPTVEAIIAMHERLSKATSGKPVVPPTWTLMNYLITPHPLGGCCMGTSPDDGVVNHAGEVFGYKNLYVADAAIIPEALGVNPSRTIGALAERIAKIIREEAR